MISQELSYVEGLIASGATTTIPINFFFDRQVSELVVYVAGGVLTSADWSYHASPDRVIIQNGANNSKYAEGLSVRVQRQTGIEQAIQYVEGVEVQSKNVVSELDRLALILQEQKDTGGRGVLPQLVNLWYGWTDKASLAEVRGGGIDIADRAVSAFNTPADRMEKQRSGVFGYPILIQMEAPAVNGFYYPWIALPNSWDNVFFFENWRHSDIWVDSRRTVDLNNIRWKVWYKRVPSIQSGKVTVEVRRYE